MTNVKAAQQNCVIYLLIYLINHLFFTTCEFSRAHWSIRVVNKGIYTLLLKIHHSTPCLKSDIFTSYVTWTSSFYLVCKRCFDWHGRCDVTLQPSNKRTYHSQPFVKFILRRFYDTYTKFLWWRRTILRTYQMYKNISIGANVQFMENICTTWTDNSGLN